MIQLSGIESRQVWLSCLTGHFHGIESRILNKIYSEPLIHALFPRKGWVFSILSKVHWACFGWAVDSFHTSNFGSSYFVVLWPTLPLSEYSFCSRDYTANVLVAETATISCVTFPVALQMHYVQLLAAANFWYNFCNFELQILQLYRFFILKIFAAIFAPYRCILEEEITINLLGLNPWPITPNPRALLSELPGMMDKSVTSNE